MRSATSFFDKTLIRTDVRRYWPLLFVYTGIWTILLPVVQWSNLPYDEYAGDYIYNMMTGGLAMAVVFGLLMAMALYAYLMNARSVGLMHSLPVTRHTQFFSHFIAGMGMLTVGKVFVVLASLGVQMLYHNTDVKATLLWFAVTTLLELFFFSLGVLCCMLTGWLLAAPVIYAAANSFVIIMTVLLQALGELFYFGYHSGSMPAITRWLTPVYILGEVLGENFYTTETYEYNGATVTEWVQKPRVMNPDAWPVLIAYTVLALVFLALAYLLYQKRASESAADLVAFGWAKPIFRYGIAVYGGISFGFGLYSLLVMNSNEAFNTALLLICVVLMGVLWSFAAEMLIRKSFRVFRSGWKGAVLLSVSLVAVCVAVRLDITGYETRVPDMADVVSVDVNLSHEDVRIYDATTPETIAAVLDLHEAIVAEGRVPEETEDGYRVNISYALKNGTILNRRYLLSWDAAEESALIYDAAEAVINAKEVRYYSVLDMNSAVSVSQIRGGYLTGKMFDMDRQLTAEEAQKLYHAILDDLNDGSGTREPLQRERPQSSIYIELDCGATNLWIDNFYPDFTETIKVLVELGAKPEQMFTDNYGNFVAWDEG